MINKQKRTYLILCHLHVDDYVVDDLVHRFLDGAAKLARVDHGVNKLKCAEDQVLKTHHLACEQTFDKGLCKVKIMPKIQKKIG